MNEIKIFENAEFGSVRTIEENGKVMFCGKDVAKALGYKESHKAISRHCKGGMKRPTPTNGGLQEMIFISEGDIYRLAAKSELPSAEKFESWIFDEVLPSIRRTGGYQIPQSRPDKDMNVKVKEMNARVRMSNQYLKVDSSLELSLLSELQAESVASIEIETIKANDFFSFFMLSYLFFNHILCQ